MFPSCSWSANHTCLTGSSLTTYQVLSSVVAAWADVTAASEVVAQAVPPATAGLGSSLELVSGVVQKLNVGYMWMLINCMASAAYVSTRRSLPALIQNLTIWYRYWPCENGSRSLGFLIGKRCCTTICCRSRSWPSSPFFWRTGARRISPGICEPPIYIYI